LGIAEHPILFFIAIFKVEFRLIYAVCMGQETEVSPTDIIYSAEMGEFTTAALFWTEWVDQRETF
jgi:hypothetical protein